MEREFEWSILWVIHNKLMDKAHLFSPDDEAMQRRRHSRILAKCFWPQRDDLYIRVNGR